MQVVWSWRKGSRSIEHLGSAHDEVELAALKNAAAERLAAGQTELDDVDDKARVVLAVGLADDPDTRWLTR